MVHLLLKFLGQIFGLVLIIFILDEDLQETLLKAKYTLLGFIIENYLKKNN